MSNYSATVVRIKEIRKHSNADRLAITTIFGNNVIIGKDTQVGDLGIFFPVESQLSEEFCAANDLIRRKDTVTGKPAGGMFDINRRVRAQTLRGEKSQGFWIPVTAMENLIGSLNIIPPIFDEPEGFEFEGYLGVNICQKYVPAHGKVRNSGTGKKGKGAPRESKIIPGQFAFHGETSQLGKNLHKLEPDDDVVLTWKMHGTSAIAANCLVKRKLTLVEKFLLWLNVRISHTTFDYIYASRRVIKNEFMESKNHYYSEDLWTRVGKEKFGDKLQPGETVYYEIVGYSSVGGYIQKGYDYGCVSGQHRVYVYRITKTDHSGNVIELPWNHLEARCKEIGVETVPVIFIGKMNEIADYNSMYLTMDEWRTSIFDILKDVYVHDQDSQFCRNTVPEEGICVRKEAVTIEVLKLKADRFFEHETKSLDAGELDMETNEALEEAA